MSSPEKRNHLTSLINPFLIITGLYKKPPSKNELYNKLYFVYAYFAQFLYFVFYLSIFVEMMRLIIFRYEMTFIITSFTVVITMSKTGAQAIIYVKNDVLKIYDEVEEKERLIWEENDPKIKKLYLDRIKVGRVFRFLVGFTTFATAAVLDVTGAYANFQLLKYNREHNTTIESHHMYMFWFPYNRLDHLGWIFFINFFTSYTAVTYTITANLITVMLLINASAHLAVIQHRLRTYIPEDLDERKMPETIMVLKKLISEHQYLIEYTMRVNDRCKNIIMMEYLLTSLEVAFASIEIIKMNMSELGWLCFYFSALVNIIFSLSWSANEVNVQSQEIAKAAYQSKWYLLNKEGRQLTQILIHRAQKPLTMTIGPFGPMTLQSFLVIMKVSYSYVTVMREK